MKRSTAILLAVGGVVALAAAVILLVEPEERTPTGFALGDRRSSGSSATNVLVIIADDVGVDKVTSYAQDADPDYSDSADYLPTTTSMDALAAAGVRFTDAWANPTCSPTRAALMTGQHGFRTGMGEPLGHSSDAGLDPAFATLADLAAEQGYASGAFGKWHLGQNDPPDDWADGDTWMDHLDQPMDQPIHPLSVGFTKFVGTMHGGLDEGGEGTGYTDYVAVQGTYCAGCATENNVIAELRTDYATDRTVDDALTWIERQRSPWLAVVSFHAGHEPWEQVSEGCSYRNPDDSAPNTTTGIYEEMVECLDRNIGDLLDGIDDLDDTLVIFVGDNGTDHRIAEGSFADGRGKGTLYETGVRVPMVVADGRTIVAARADFAATMDWRESNQSVSDPGREVADPVHVVDIFATVAEVIGADGSEGLDSISMIPLLSDADGTTRTVNYSEQFSSSGTGTAAVRLHNYKLIAQVSADSSGGRCRGAYELYDVDADPFETTEVSADQPDELATLQAELDTIAASEAGSWLDVDDC